MPRAAHSSSNWWISRSPMFDPVRRSSSAGGAAGSGALGQPRPSAVAAGERPGLEIQRGGPEAERAPVVAFRAAAPGRAGASPRRQGPQPRQRGVGGDRQRQHNSGGFAIVRHQRHPRGDGHRAATGTGPARRPGQRPPRVPEPRAPPSPRADPPPEPCSPPAPRSRPRALRGGHFHRRRAPPPAGQTANRAAAAAGARHHRGRFRGASISAPHPLDQPRGGQLGPGGGADPADVPQHRDAIRQPLISSICGCINDPAAAALEGFDQLKQPRDLRARSRRWSARPSPATGVRGRGLGDLDHLAGGQRELLDGTGGSSRASRAEAPARLAALAGLIHPAPGRAAPRERGVRHAHRADEGKAPGESPHPRRGRPPAGLRQAHQPAPHRDPAVIIAMQTPPRIFDERGFARPFSRRGHAPRRPGAPNRARSRDGHRAEPLGDPLHRNQEGGSRHKGNEKRGGGNVSSAPV